MSGGWVVDPGSRWVPGAHNARSILTPFLSQASLGLLLGYFLGVGWKGVGSDIHMGDARSHLLHLFMVFVHSGSRGLKRQSRHYSGKW